MNLYLVERTDDVGYDEYDAFIVSATSEGQAQECINIKHGPNDSYSEWSNKVTVNLIGTYKGDKSEIILGSFNAG
jgi:hypothetical protein